MLKPLTVLTLLALALSACAGGGGSVTGPVGRACITGGRDAATRSLCSCVQRAASQTLNASDQTRAARFFDDPQQAQDTRQSDRASDEAFWDRYNVFVDRARATCG